MKYLKLLILLLPISLISCDELEEDDCRSCWGKGWNTNCVVCNSTGYLDCRFCEYGSIKCQHCIMGYNSGKLCTICKGNYRTKCSIVEVFIKTKNLQHVAGKKKFARIVMEQEISILLV